MNRRFAIGFKNDSTVCRVLVQYTTMEEHLKWIEAHRDIPGGSDLVLLEKIGTKWVIVS